MQAHRGDALVSLCDFHKTRIDVVEKIVRFHTFYRDHGHKENILNSWEAVDSGAQERAVSSIYNESTSRLILGVKKAVESGKELTIAL